MTARDDRDELRALAESGPPPPAPPAKPAFDHNRWLQDESLVSPWMLRIDRALPFGVAIGGAGVSLLLVALVDRAYLPVALGVCLALFVGMFGVWRLARWIESGRERRWVMSPPIPLDGEGYLRLLGEFSSTKVVVVRLVPREPPASADQELAASAARAGHGVASAAWEDGALVIRSQPLETAAFRGGKRRHSNHRVHHWFKPLATRVLVPITRVVPASTITVT